ncbi:MAG: hypothetical protein KGJ75_05155 [Alphaproteobacteria bacterium]|nr:hypothetical protein [Alphaproteobacteria bacterium]
MTKQLYDISNSLSEQLAAELADISFEDLVPIEISESGGSYLENLASTFWCSSTTASSLPTL